MAPLRLHGIVKATDDLVLGIGGGDGAGPVQVLAASGLGCVVSACRGEDLGTLSREELVKRLFAHQQVVELVMEQQAVLPVKFGTVLDDTPEVLDLLRQG
ncbi:MAG: GvpL/GvpF family gas vesicle protein, partial [Chloroflexota bacterium]|nr:GvpL/GvpF family gas vesicle protein [Chloroflexota bacterium]